MTDQPEPTPAPPTDRAVGDDVRSLTIDQLIDGFAVNTGKEPFIRSRVERARVLRAELVRRLTITATERPADDTVTISKRSARQGQIALRAARIGMGKRPPYIQDNIRDAYDEFTTALSAASGEPTDA